MLILVTYFKISIVDKSIHSINLSLKFVDKLKFVLLIDTFLNNVSASKFHW